MAPTQADISAETEAAAREYAASGRIETQPRLDFAPYRSGLLRFPTKAPVSADLEGVELWAPDFGHSDVDEVDADLAVQHRGEPIGERMIVTDRVNSGKGRRVRRELVELRDQNGTPLEYAFNRVRGDGITLQIQTPRQRRRATQEGEA